MTVIIFQIERMILVDIGKTGYRALDEVVERADMPKRCDRGFGAMLYGRLLVSPAPSTRSGDCQFDSKRPAFSQLPGRRHHRRRSKGDCGSPYSHAAVAPAQKAHSPCGRSTAAAH